MQDLFEHSETVGAKHLQQPGQQRWQHQELHAQLFHENEGFRAVVSSQSVHHNDQPHV